MHDGVVAVCWPHVAACSSFLLFHPKGLLLYSSSPRLRVPRQGAADANASLLRPHCRDNAAAPSAAPRQRKKAVPYSREPPPVSLANIPPTRRGPPLHLPGAARAQTTA